MIIHRVARLIAFTIAVMAFSWSQNAPGLKYAPAPLTSPTSAKEMFKAYCASCHGNTTKGNGPAAPALKTPPPDLTMLAKRNGGKFPTDRVLSILRGRAMLAAHGSQEMPVWGPVFWRMSQGHDSEVQMRVSNLTRYLQSLQAK